MDEDPLAAARGLLVALLIEFVLVVIALTWWYLR
jgi:hypothetical protein